MALNPNNVGYPSIHEDEAQTIGALAPLTYVGAFDAYFAGIKSKDKAMLEAVDQSYFAKNPNTCLPLKEYYNHTKANAEGFPELMATLGYEIIYHIVSVESVRAVYFKSV